MRRYLVPLDGTGEDEISLAQVHRIARKADVDLLHVIPSPPLPVGTPPAAVVHRLPEQALEYLTEVRLRLPDCGGQNIVRSGDPAEEILGVALALNTDQIVMGTHARKGLARAMLGSVSAAVVRRADFPVLVARPDLPAPRPEVRTILVALDDSDESERILPAVDSLATATGAHMCVLHVVSGQSGNGGGPESGRRRVEAGAERLRRAGRAAVPILAHGDPAGEILAKCASLEADLVAMTTHARGGAKRALLGSVAEAVVRKAPAAALLLRTRER